MEKAMVIRRLRREWAAYIFISVTFLLAGFLILHRTWDEEATWRWLAIAGAILVYQWFYLFRNLPRNYLKNDCETLFPTLGLANWITITRALLNAALAGFFLGPRPAGWLAWAPSLLYMISSLMDFADGIAARMTGRITLLGEMLDMHWDGAGMLIASVLAVFYGQAPALYLLVGLARYLFLIGQWLRTRQGLPVFDLPPNRIRRPFAGTQMVFVAVLLMPLYSPPATHVVSWLFMTPFLLNFFFDWLVVSGVIQSSDENPAMRRITAGKLLGPVFPLAVRAGLICLLVEMVIHIIQKQPLDMVVLVISATAVPFLLLGAAGRIIALAVLLMAGMGLQVYPLEWRYWAILIFSAVSMLVGTGRFSIWTPEDWLLFKQVGEKRPAARV